MVMEVLTSVGAEAVQSHPGVGERHEGGGSHPGVGQRQAGGGSHPRVVVPVGRWGDSLETLWGTEHRLVVTRDGCGWFWWRVIMLALVCE